MVVRRSQVAAARAPEDDSLPLAFKVLNYPKLGMRLDLGSVYSRAELEARCGRCHPKRRSLLHDKMRDPSLFSPAPLEKALERGKGKSSSSTAKPAWVRPPAILPKGEDEKDEVGRRRMVADGIAKALLANPKRIEDKHVLSCLRAWGFYQNSLRLNVMPKDGPGWVYSDTLGLTNSRDGRVVPSLLSKNYPNFTKLLNRWLVENRPAKCGADFPFTSISVNSLYAAKRHRDKNNKGPSVIKTFGNFKGGDLRYFPRDSGKGSLDALKVKDSVVLTVKNAAGVFDGRKAHEVTKFHGKERFSLVWFSVGRHDSADDSSKKTIHDLGFTWPTDDNIKRASKLVEEAYETQGRKRKSWAELC